MENGITPKRPNELRHPDAVVYLVQEPTIPRRATQRKIDISPMMWWGEVRVLVERNQAPGFRPMEAYLQIYNRLAQFDPDRDFIAAVGGDTLGVMLTSAALREYGHEYFYFLRFERTRLPNGERDPSSGEYYPILAPLSHDVAKRALATFRNKAREFDDVGTEASVPTSHTPSRRDLDFGLDEH